MGVELDPQFELYGHIKPKRAGPIRYTVLDRFVSHRTRGGKGCVGRLVERDRNKRKGKR